MAISNNSQWNYGTILTPEKMNNIEYSLDQMVMGAINKTTTFEDNKIIEYFGDVIIINDIEYQNKKTTEFIGDGSIQETYDLYFKAGDNNNVNIIHKQYVKTTVFGDDLITETLEVIE